MKQKNFRKLFTIYFIAFGVIISLLGASINYYIQTMQTNKILKQKASEIFKIRNEVDLTYHLNDISNTLNSLKSNQLVKDYVSSKNNNNEKNLKNLFLNVINSNNLIMKVRYVNKDGKEIIRVEKNSKNSDSFVVDEAKLKDEKESDFFKNISKLNDDSIWYSKLGLDTESNQVEQLYKPTLIVGIPIFNKNNFDGIVAINVFLDDLLKMVSKSSVFNHYIVDKNKNYIFHPDEEYSFNVYKNIKRDIKEDFPDGLEADKIFTYSLEKIFKNEENLLMILKPKDDYEKEIFFDKLLLHRINT